MKKILFRGKRLDGEWIEGALLTFNGRAFINNCPETHATLSMVTCVIRGFVEVIPETVGQYTGLTDKNGTEIYEGDIVKGKDNAEKSIEIFGYVDFTNGSFVVVGDVITHYRWIDYEVEVIGNIHDTPELLEASDD